MKKIFIDGSAGTTGLRIKERLLLRKDIELIILPEEKRKDEASRRDALNSADISVLCLPDDAAREAAAFAENPDTVIIDTSTAHRTDENFIYGFPEIADNRQRIAAAKRIANPGCHASGFISLIAPLTENKIIAPDTPLSCFSLTGYSGGGKKMIAEYQADGRDPLLNAPRMYGLTQSHKHLPEMIAVTGLKNKPIFSPVVADFYSGMAVTVPLFADMINGSADDIKKIYKEKYTGPIVSYAENADENGFIAANKLAGKDSMEISVAGNDERILLISRYDNLGKGASGAAIECMNIVLGLPETEGLNL